VCCGPYSLLVMGNVTRWLSHDKSVGKNNSNFSSEDINVIVKKVIKSELI
jgi:hypothetical protein